MITREEAKEMFRNDKDSFGKPKGIMGKIDKIYDSFIDVDYKEHSKKLSEKLLTCDIEILKYIVYLEYKSSFVYIIEDRKGNYISFHNSNDSAKKEIDRIQKNYKEKLVINCQKIY